MRYVARPTPLDPGSAPSRSSIGGHPFLPADAPWPVCPESGKPMVLFFQLDVPEGTGVAVRPGSHLLVFMSPAVNEIDTFERAKNGAPLPDGFWRARLPHFKVMLFGPEVELVAHPDEDAYLVPQRLDFAPEAEPDDPFLFIGGEPRWYQDAEAHPGFGFLCQLSENYPFARKAEAPVQPDTFSKKAYCLFLGNAAYFFAREAPRDPEDVWIALQN
ncbi:MAG: hypothetical protein HOO96_13885 [Polyangiaceae bacterium]|nr:hypothetical protein [Polyangiaceae bacterium]